MRHALVSAIRASGSFDREAYQHSGTEFGFTFPPDDDTLTRTTFEFVNWGKLELLHTGLVRFAVADAGEGVVDVTTLDVKPHERAE